MNKKTIELQIGGKERTFWYGLGFLGQLLSALDTDIEGMESIIQKNPFKTIPLMMFISLKYGYDRVGAKVPHTLFEVQEWIDDSEGITGQVVTDYLDGFKKSIASVGETADPKTRKQTSKKATVKKK